MCQKNLPFCLMILKVSINLKNMENLNKVLAQCLKFWATHEWQKRSPHSLSQWVQINETSVLKHMCFLFPNLLSPTLSGLKLNIICTTSPVLVTISHVQTFNWWHPMQFY